MNQSLLGYFAGLFDGEGYVTCQKYKRGSWIVVGLGMTDREPIDLLAITFGGHVKTEHKRSGWKTLYRWVVTGPNARAFLQMIQPLCVVKKRRIELALEYCSLLRPHGSRLAQTQEVIARRDAILAELQLLNKRGTKHQFMDTGEAKP